MHQRRHPVRQHNRRRRAARRSRSARGTWTSGASNPGFRAAAWITRRRPAARREHRTPGPPGRRGPRPPRRAAAKFRQCARRDSTRTGRTAGPAAAARPNPPRRPAPAGHQDRPVVAGRGAAHAPPSFRRHGEASVFAAQTGQRRPGRSLCCAARPSAESGGETTRAETGRRRRAASSRGPSSSIGEFLASRSGRTVRISDDRHRGSCRTPAGRRPPRRCGATAGVLVEAPPPPARGRRGRPRVMDDVRLPTAEPEPAATRRGTPRPPCGARRRRGRPGRRSSPGGVCSGRPTYSRVTAGPDTITSPISPAGRSRTFRIEATGSSLSPITRTVTAGNGRPTQVPAPARVLAAVSSRISSVPMSQTGNASVAPYGVCNWVPAGRTARAHSCVRGGTGAPAESNRFTVGSVRPLSAASRRTDFQRAGEPNARSAPCRAIGPRISPGFTAAGRCVLIRGTTIVARSPTSNSANSGKAGTSTSPSASP